MNSPDSTTISDKRADVSDLPPAKWWGRYTRDSAASQPRFVIHWGRIMMALALLGLAGYLTLVSALWGFYTYSRKIAGISWFDVATLRFERVQASMASYFLSEAKSLWEKQSLAPAFMTARAAVLKAPRNLEARYFLAERWRLVGRVDEAIRILKEGIQYYPTDAALQKTLIETCQAGGRPLELLKILREEYPAQGVRLLDGNNRVYQIAEAQAILETAGAGEAEALVSRRAGLSDDPSAAPLMARIDWELNRKQAAFDRLALALDRAPENPVIHEAFVEAALQAGKADEARKAADRFLVSFPNYFPAQLKFLEAHNTRKGVDEKPWATECLRILVQYRRVPAAMGQLGSLAAAQGWTDLAYLLYENSLEENNTGFPFAIFYIASLVKAGNYSLAEAAWRDLSVHNSAQLASAAHLEVLVLLGSGRESEAMQIVDRLRRETEGNYQKRHMLERIFRTFGLPKMAELLNAPKPAPATPGLD